MRKRGDHDQKMIGARTDIGCGPLYPVCRKYRAVNPYRYPVFQYSSI
jgi:hypothetical protein